MKEPLLPSLFKLTANIVLGAIALWLAGLLIFFFAVAQTGPKNPKAETDVIIVLTGGTMRIEEGLQLLAEGRAKAMLVTGVHPGVSREALINRWPASGETKERLLAHCCLFIEHKASTTEENAAEARAWLDRNGGAQGVSIRLVTSDYHMPRARLLFRRAMPQAAIYPWPVRTQAMASRYFSRMLTLEYVKFILTWLA